MVLNFSPLLILNYLELHLDQTKSVHVALDPSQNAI